MNCLSLCFTGCSKTDVSGLSLPWSLWLLCPENMLESDVILWKGWQSFEREIWKQHPDFRQTEKKVAQERQKPAKNTHPKRRPALYQQVTQLLCGRSQAGSPWDAGKGLQPDFRGTRWMQSPLLWPGIQHTCSQARGEMRLQVCLVLLCTLQKMREYDRCSHLQMMTLSLSKDMGKYHRK